MGAVRRQGKTWWIRYSRDGRRYEENSHSDKKGKAIEILKLREGDGARGVNVTPKINRLRFDEAARDLVTDFEINGKRSLRVVQIRIRLHLEPWFGMRRMATIGPADIRAYIAARLKATTVTKRAYTLKTRSGAVREIPAQTRTIARPSNAQINRELQILKRIFALAVQSGKLLYKPHIELLKERNTRTGFFEPEQYASVHAHLPAALQPVIEFAYITGWRIDSEVLPLEWRHVDFAAGEVRLDAHTTKNDAPRTFPMTDDLRALLEAQHAEHLQRKKAGTIVPWVFVRLVAEGRGGKKQPRKIVTFTKAWKVACLAAGCPGRIPHDLRRTAVRTMVRRGVPERVAMQLTGHKTRSIFERYNIVSDGDLKTAAARLGGLTRASGLGRFGDPSTAKS